MLKKSERFNSTDIQLIEVEPLYQGFFKMERWSFRHALFAGGQSKLVRREVYERGDAVVVLPYDPKLDEVVLIEQLRIPTLGRTDTPWLFELVAGMIDKDQSPAEVAMRELQEETGLQAKSLHFISKFFSSPGGSSEQVSLYLAEVDASQAKGIHGLDDEHEDIRVHRISREQAYQWVEEGIIDNASSIIGVQWLQLAYQLGRWRDPL